MARILREARAPSSALRLLPRSLSVTILTPDRILALAPDPASAKAGAALAAARKWSGLGGDGEGRAVWGECQGSGATPYRTRVDLTDFTARCSCPSRKFPCKHALGLLLLVTAEPELFQVTEPPAWVAEWLAGRDERSERKRQRDTETPAASDAERDAESARASEAARRKREAARADKISAGLAELARWLEDLVRGGLASVATRPASFWSTAAARLVDAQAPGAARLVRQLATIPSSGTDWAGRMVAALARLHLLTEAYERLATLPPAMQADVRATLGWSTASDESADGAAIADEWLVVGQVIEDEDRLRARRTWLVGRRSGRQALLLHFAHGTAPFAESVPPPGSVISGELAFLPGVAPMRATLRSRDGSAAIAAATPPPPGHARFVDATGAWSAALAANPWTERVLVVLAAAVPEWRGERWLVRDLDGAALSIASPFRAGWPLVALAGGRPIWLSAEWDGERLLPLAAASNGSLVSLTAPLVGPA